MLLSLLASGFTRSGQDHDITAVTEDSRKVTPGALFVAIAGTAKDGHAYIRDAIARGAAAIVAERTGEVPESVARIQVADARKALASLAAKFYGEPGQALELVGFTGTFGKTSTSEVLRTLLSAAGARTGVLGSLGARFESFRDDRFSLTTPAPVELNRALRGLRDAGAERVIMEVTSHALRLGRVDGLMFSGGLLAAIKAGEHTDFHRTYQDYLEAKRLFLDYLAPGATLAFDADNPAARQLATERSSVRPVGFSIEGRAAHLMFRGPALGEFGARFRIEGALVRGTHQMTSALLGGGHLRNVALALTYALASGVEPSAASRLLEGLQPLPRRMERYVVEGRTILDDSAAHPESFRAAFAVAGMLAHERLVVVYALRGNRGSDTNARNAEALADLASDYMADALIITASSDTTSDENRVTPDELEAASDALATRGRAFVAREALLAAVTDALERTRGGDLILLIGAQGMNRGKELLVSSAGSSSRT